jgi:hypothetical protein
MRALALTVTTVALVILRVSVEVTTMEKEVVVALLAREEIEARRAVPHQSQSQ